MNLIGNLRKNICVKASVIIAYTGMVFQPLITNIAYAGNGPMQPEFQGPSVMTPGQYVDPFTGNFSYAIDILSDVGIPMSLNYSAGISMEQDATWVGLGWTLNPGSIVRSVRGLPDDFNGEKIIETTKLRPNITAGLNTTIGPHELVGMGNVPEAEGLTLGLDVHYNTYSGLGISTMVNIFENNNNALDCGFTVNSSTENSFGGVGISPELNVNKLLKKLGLENTFEAISWSGLTPSANFSLNSGLKSFNIGAFNNRFSSKNYINFDKNYTPSIEKEFASESYSLYSVLSTEFLFTDGGLKLQGYYSNSELKNKVAESPAYGYLHLKNESNKKKEVDYIQDINRENDIPVQPSAPTLPTSYYTYDIYDVTAPGISGSFRAHRNDWGYIQDKQAKNTMLTTGIGFELGAANTAKLGLDIEVNKGGSTTKTFGKNNKLANSEFEHKQKDYIENEKNQLCYFKYLGENYIETEENFTTNLKTNVAVEPEFSHTFFTPKIETADLTYNDHNYYPGSDENLPSFHTINTENTFRDEIVGNNKIIQYYTKSEIEKFEELNKYQIGNKYKYQLNENAKDDHIVKIMITAEDGTKYIFGLPAYNTTHEEITFNVGKSNPNDKSPPVTYEEDYLVHYTKDDPDLEFPQNSVKNESGVDHFYNKKQIPAYVYTYLLTDVLSPDYVDVTGNGPSDDDMGTYVTYTYGIKDGEIFKPNIEEFKWRTPLVDEQRAAYVEGLTNDASDDRANILHGTKEVWFLSGIETKTGKAEFFISNRNDGFTSSGMDGFINFSGPCLSKLDSIQVFSKFDILRDEYDGVSGELEIMDDLLLKPIKTVVFEYDYTLCQGIPNNQVSPEGRLSLKKIYFRYFDSYKTKYNYYDFTYNEGEETVYYNRSWNDRWGTIQENLSETPNRVFPYTQQTDRELADMYAGLWSLKRIGLPNGGFIEVDYEADDYAYVQNKRAGQMFSVASTFTTISSAEDPVLTSELLTDGGNDRLYYSELDGEGTNYYLSFILPETEEIDGTETQNDADKLFREKYLLNFDNQLNDPEGVENNLFFRFYTNTDDRFNDDGSLSFLIDEDDGIDDEDEFEYEYVEGYAQLDIQSCGVAKSTDPGNYDRGYIKLNPAYYKGVTGEYVDNFLNGADIDFETDYNAHEVNPITKACWQYSMLNAKNNILDIAPPDESLTAEDFLNQLTDKLLVDQLLDMFMNPNMVMNKKGLGSQFTPEKSIIRLYNPNGSKVGGGIRVKEIRYADNWGQMTNDNEGGSIYGTMYRYSDPNVGISSGVASWEPAAGGEENIWKYPDTYTHRNGEYGYEFYKLHPFGEALFPASTVGYSYVEEIPFGQYESEEGSGVYSEKRTELGKTIYQFYTAKDFPTKTQRTEVNPINRHLAPKFGIAGWMITASNELYAASQGFVIETNDMHGKPKSVEVLNGQNTAVISKIEYIYYTDENNNLYNKVAMLDNFGNVTTVDFGVQYEIFNDFRINNTWSVGGGVKLGIDISGAAPPPSPFIMLLPSTYPHITAAKETSAIAVITKHVQKKGILKETITTTNGSSVKSANLVFDKKTGNPLIVTQENEFGDTYYVTNIPAHWIYSGMSQASDNWRYSFNYDPDAEGSGKINIVTGEIENTELKNILEPGDYIAFTIGKPGYFGYKGGWVYKEVPETGPVKWYIIDETGNKLNFIDDPELVNHIGGFVYDSGKQNTPSASVTTLITRQDPIDWDEIEHISGSLVIDESKQIIDASAQEYSDIWRLFCTEGAALTEVCNCADGYTAGASFLAIVIAALSADNKLLSPYNYLEYEENVFLYKFNDLDLDDEIDEGEVTLNYSFLDAFSSLIGIPDPESGTGAVLWFSDQDVDLSTLNCHIRNAVDGNGCSFKLDFGDIEIGDEDFIDIFDNTDDLSVLVTVPESDPEECLDVNKFSIKFTYKNNEGSIVNATADCDLFECFSLRNCGFIEIYPPYCYGAPGDEVNPYLRGVKGIWRPKVSYKYLTERTPEAYFTGASPTGNVASVRNQGDYQSFVPFWELVGDPVSWVKSENEGWVWSVQNSKFDPFALGAETMDALGIYSSQTFGLNSTNAEMVSGNSAYWQIGFDNFEDDLYYDFYRGGTCHKRHFNLEPEGTSGVSREYAHSGNFSIKIPESQAVSYSHTLNIPNLNREYYEEPPFLISNEDCLPDFAPTTDEVDAEYLLTFWYRDYRRNAELLEGNPLNIQVTLDATQDLIVGEPVFSDEIEDWRRVEVKIKMPSEIDLEADNVFNITLENEGETDALFVDDVKINPLNSGNNCYVYDFMTQRLMAEMDDNHYATFYEYDTDGKLLRIKKETERGIFTIQDARYNIPKKEF